MFVLFFSRFFFESERGIFPQTEFVFDLELPIDFQPKNNDGEVDEFALEKASDVSMKNELLKFWFEFKKNKIFIHFKKLE